jgi:hypothetical protein
MGETNIGDSMLLGFHLASRIRTCDPLSLTCALFVLATKGGPGTFWGGMGHKSATLWG